MTQLPTVLIVDDELRSLEALQRILEDDFDVRTAVTVEEAEEILEGEVGRRSCSATSACRT